MKAANYLALAVYLVATTGCTTQYAPQSARNIGGFSETEVAPQTWRVVFAGNERLAPSQSEDYAKLRAAELCLAAHKPFMVLSQFSTDLVEKGVDKGRLIRTHGPSGYGTGRAQHSDGVIRSTVIPGKRLFGATSSLTVTCVDESVSDATPAAEVASQLRQRYDLNSGSTRQTPSR